MIRLAAAVWLVAAAGCSHDPACLKAAGPADLRSDSDGDGRIAPADDAVEESREALVLVNVDDDDGEYTPDASDDVLHADGRDLEDFTEVRLLPWPAAPADATGVLSLHPASARRRVHVFRRTDDDSATMALSMPRPVSAAELRTGIVLLVEAAEPASGSWDGAFRIELEVESGLGKATDRVRFHVAPILFWPDAALPRQVLYSSISSESDPFRIALERDVPPTKLVPIQSVSRTQSRWMRDMVRIGFTTRPGPGGDPVGMEVVIPSVVYPHGSRVASELLVPGVGKLDVAGSGAPLSEIAQGMTAFGNFAVLPPHAGYPRGRSVWGQGSGATPDPALLAFLGAQRLQSGAEPAQPGMTVDTSWICPPHLDELMTVVPGPDGFLLIVADPAAAADTIEARLGRGEKPDGSLGRLAYTPGLLGDLVSSSRTAWDLHVAKQVQKLAAEVGNERILRVPVLFEYDSAEGCFRSYQPNPVNLLALGSRLLIPDPLGPLFDGTDVLLEETREVLAAASDDLRFVDVYDQYHYYGGQLHCATNDVRARALETWCAAP